MKTRTKLLAEIEKVLPGITGRLGTLRDYLRDATKSVSLQQRNIPLQKERKKPGRKPVGERAMTSTQRSRRRRRGK
jgi:hypothetical protein